MKTDVLEQRRAELYQELAAGKEALAQLERQATTICSQMLRINGAIQVLEELLAAENTSRATTQSQVVIAS